MINAYYVNKEYLEAIELFEELIIDYEGLELEPENVTFAVMLKVLSECDISLHFGVNMYHGIEKMKYDKEYVINSN